MAAKRRKKKLIKIRKPKMRLTSKGLKVTRPSARIGGKAGVNISSKGVSASARTRRGTISTRKGRSTAARSSVWPAQAIANESMTC